MKNLAIIPARSGSKGLEDKNIKILNGQPLMAYTIQAALSSKVFEEVMVSTDSNGYADIARKYGAEVPFLRSEKTSSDLASSWDMVDEVLSKYKEGGRQFDTLCLLQPTSPLRTDVDIKEAYELLVQKSGKAVVSVCEAEHSPEWYGVVPPSLKLNGFIAKGKDKQRQAMEKYYRINGAIYITKISFFNEDHFLYRDGCYAYIMDQKRSVDIDTEVDFALAEVLMNAV